MQVAFVGRPKHVEQACAVFLELLHPDRVTGRRMSPGHKYDSFTMRAALPYIEVLLSRGKIIVERDATRPTQEAEIRVLHRR